MSLNFLDDVAEFKELVRSLQSGETSLRISGLIEAAKPFFFSFLAQKLEKRIVFIQPASASLSRLEEQCRFFSSQWTPSRHVKALPALKENPYQEASPPLEAVSSRLLFFYDLLSRQPSLILTNLFGLLKPFPSPEGMPNLFMKLNRGEFFDRDKLIRTLEEYGYSREDLISFRGEYAWRGGIV
ncbi:MAG: transcription-repair coupling factor, partial [Candidatus Aminicenantes bacterium]|nr:transcription-repair coupling factor [Candidatus Aminicenantes bacterium]